MLHPNRNTHTHTHTHIYFLCLPYKLVVLARSVKWSYETTSTFSVWSLSSHLSLFQPHIHASEGFPDGSVVKNLLAMQESWVPSLGQEDPLKEEMATHFSILAWKTPWTEDPGGLQSIGLQRVGQDWVTKHGIERWPQRFVQGKYTLICPWMFMDLSG